MDNPAAANILGTAGAVFWSVQLIPQIVVNYRRHHTTGLQPTMMLLWTAAGIPLGVYNIAQNFNVALQIQPQILTLLSLVTWAQCKYYRDGGVDPSRWSIAKCAIVVSSVSAVMGGIEVALVFALREAVKKHLEWPGMLMAVLAAVLLSAGVARHYWDIYQERTVRGISFFFVALDAMGDLTSLISLVFQPELDVLGMVIYGSELVLWLGIFACGGWFNFRPWLVTVKDRWNSGVRHAGSDPAPIELNGSEGMSSAIEHHSLSIRRLSSSSSISVFRTASGLANASQTRLSEDHVTGNAATVPV